MKLPSARRRLVNGSWVALLVGATSVACSGRSVGRPGAGTGGSEVGAGGAAGASVAASAGEATGGNATTCQSGDVAAKRLVRLSFNQVLGTVGELLGPALHEELSQDEGLTLEPRSFPVLAAPNEGQAYVEGNLQVLDRLARRASEHVLDDFSRVTGCESPSDACARVFLANFAEAAFRRPLTDSELERLEGRYAAFRSVDVAVTVELAVQHSVYAIFHAPQFLYRTEFGDDPGSAGPLSAVEAASLLSYFLTDAPPDAELLAAATANELTDPAALGAQAKRLLQTPAAERTLSSAMSSYFRYDNVDTVVIDDPGFTAQFRSSIKGEAARFLERTLWRGKLEDFVLARTSFVDAQLAPIYGLSAFPPPGANVDAGGFVELELPPGRVGVLTQPGFLTAHARPQGTSVIQRGFVVRSAFVDGVAEPPPPVLPEELEALFPDLEQGASARRWAEARVETESCAECHAGFDGYGVALETFDSLGRYRAVDPQGRPIDTSFPLPSALGGGTAAGIVEIAERLAASGALPRRFAQALAMYALAPTEAWPIEGSAFEVRGCAVSRIAERLDPKSATFSDLIEALVTEPAFTERAGP
jgi:Protein of unknown function (DUF1592)/Protein of unknown function (DUF1588)/Protein of unknown function (DUF1595)